MSNKSLVSSLLVAAAIGILIAIYYSPIWWVALTAPNYPEEAFPDGVRIEFHMNGVFNGCEKIEKEEITEDEALDCVHEMDTINHYVGMYPIASGGVIERAFSQFLVALLGVMLIGFLIRHPKVRMIIMTLSFAVLAVWMYLTWYAKDGLSYQNSGYVHALVTALDQDTERDLQRPDADEVDVIPSEALIKLREAQDIETPIKTRDPAAEQPAEVAISEKLYNIEHLRQTFEKSQERKPEAERLNWDGSGSQMMSWHYASSLGKYFNNPEEIRPMVATMAMVAEVVFWGILAAMVLLVFGARKNSGLLYWLLVLVPMALPLFFIIEYSAWLWWYGHTLNDMGAFTVKPFMPTVFGQGKVAQFTTHSYPDIGFGLMLLMSVLLALAALFRRKGQAEEES
ncbi:MAG: hypothetical protein ABFR19_05065 [Pseudomonadota bacterium]